APEQFMKNHVNPDVERWELHRVYVVEATLKPGMRHVYSKRRYYIDEDTFGAGLYDAWDQNDNLYRTLYMAGVQIYDKDIPYATKLAIFDFNKNMYRILNDLLIGNLTFIAAAPSNAQQNSEVIVGKMTQRGPPKHGDNGRGNPVHSPIRRFWRPIKNIFFL